ncbi:putative manganese transporter [Alkaliphilus peptidifermentans]|uniref:Putative, 10TM heavy-metal exporter n=1 Tax=Alkaliphilus peptidifermentans DSM 18978 TaxID=1120976 RepID=A0A1G5J3A4_9FIRM|nr:putative manganese transporter [Alkaliphilus peptidifermentans]SCY82836.1 Putative, 10TM heavy-metal exporter [Alkaliphilus peptidifermentans DSM 18978]
MSILLELILDSAEGAFLEVGAFVGAVLLLFGYVNYRKSGSFIATIQNSKKWQPVIGALLGLTPGCGGAIFVMPLFFKKAVTFGTVVATLIATMGDSAFVIIASHPIQYLIISLLSFFVAIITGYIVDMTGLGNSILKKYDERKLKKDKVDALHTNLDHSMQQYECGKHGSCESPVINHIGHEEGDEIDLLLHHKLKGHQHPDTFGYRFTHNAFYLYWGFIAVGLVLGVMQLFQIEINEWSIPNLGLIFGGLGTVFSIIMMIMAKKFLGDDTHEETELKVMSLKETFIHNAQDTAFVVTWVFVGFLAYEMMILLMGGGDYAVGEATIETLLLATGILSIIIGASIGLIPGCGPQIIFVTLFTRGLVPFAALFANAVSQDGDALLPLIAIDRRSAIWATVISTIPAIIFGLIIYWFEINTGLGNIFLTTLDQFKAFLF